MVTHAGFLAFVLSTFSTCNFVFLIAQNPDGILVCLRVPTTVCEGADHVETVTQDHRLR